MSHTTKILIGLYIIVGLIFYFGHIDKFNNHKNKRIRAIAFVLAVFFAPVYMAFSPLTPIFMIFTEGQEEVKNEQNQKLEPTSPTSVKSSED